MTAHILHKNLLSASAASEVTASGFDSGWEFANALSVGTAIKAQAQNGIVGAAEYDLGGVQAISTIGIARHNLGTVEATISVYSSVSSGGPWTPELSFSPLSDDVAIKIGTTFSTQFVKIEITGHTAAAIVAVISLGEALELPRPMPNGFTPPEFGAQDEITSSYTAGRELSGITIKLKPTRTRVLLKQVRAQWFFDNWRALQASLSSTTVFFRWKESGSTIYGNTPKKPQNPKFKKSYYMDANIDLEGFIA